MPNIRVSEETYASLLAYAAYLTLDKKTKISFDAAVKNLLKETEQ